MALTKRSDVRKYVKMKQADDDKFYFILLDENYEEIERYNELEGILRNIRLGEYEFANKKYKTVSFEIEDEGITYVLQGNFNFATRSMMNQVIFAAMEGTINGSLFYAFCRTKGDRLHQIFVNIDGKKTQWAFPIEEMPGSKEVEKLDLFFEEAMKQNVLPQFSHVPKIDNDVPMADDDLPF